MSGNRFSVGLRGGGALGLLGGSTLGLGVGFGARLALLGFDSSFPFNRVTLASGTLPSRTPWSMILGTAFLKLVYLFLICTTVEFGIPSSLNTQFSNLHSSVSSNDLVWHTII